MSTPVASDISQRLRQIQNRINSVHTLTHEMASQPEISNADPYSYATALARNQYFVLNREELKRDIRWLHIYLAEPRPMNPEVITAGSLFEKALQVL